MKRKITHVSFNANSCVERVRGISHMLNIFLRGLALALFVVNMASSRPPHLTRLANPTSDRQVVQRDDFC